MRKKEFSISIVVPTCQREALLRRALLSVQRQSFDNFEVLVVNDHPPSRDRVDDVIRRLDDDRFKIVHHHEQQGGNAARNTGIRQAEGSIIAFLDDDDEWKTQKLERHFRAHKNHSVGVVYSDTHDVWENDILTARNHVCPLPQGPICEAMRRGVFCPATTSAVTVRRSCFSQTGTFDHQLVSFQDWDMWFRLARRYEFHRIAEPLVIFRQHLGQRTSKNIERRLKGLRQITTKWKGEVDVDRLRRKYGKSAYHHHIRDQVLKGEWRAAFHTLKKFGQFVDRPEDTLLLIRATIMIMLGRDGYIRLYNFRRRMQGYI